MESQFVALTPYENFVFALKAKETKRQYPHRLDKFLTFVGLEGTIQEKCNELYELANRMDMLQSYIIRFIETQKKRIENKEISEGTLCNYIKAIKLFCSMNDLTLNWKKIGKGMPVEKHNADDRVPTMDEVHKLLEHPDRRIKVIVSIMISSGIRVGSWDYLKWKHVIPMWKNNVLVAAKLTVRNTKINNREYFSFITPEAYYLLKDWMDFRKLHGEKINAESWLMRDTWEKLDRVHSHRVGMATSPKFFGSVSIRNMIGEAWRIQGIRDLLDPDKKRHEFKSTHSFRKIFETKCQKVMNHNNIKLLMDHSLGESQNYHRPLEEELLEDYLNAVDLLTINDENKLKKKILEFKERQDEIELMKLKHDSEMKKMDKKMDKIMGMVRINPRLLNVKPEILRRKIKTD